MRYSLATNPRCLSLVERWLGESSETLYFDQTNSSCSSSSPAPPCPQSIDILQSNDLLEVKLRNEHHKKRSRKIKNKIRKPLQLDSESEEDKPLSEKLAIVKKDFDQEESQSDEKRFKSHKEMKTKKKKKEKKISKRMKIVPTVKETLEPVRFEEELSESEKDDESSSSSESENESEADSSCGLNNQVVDHVIKPPQGVLTPSQSIVNAKPPPPPTPPPPTAIKVNLVNRLLDHNEVNFDLFAFLTFFLLCRLQMHTPLLLRSPPPPLRTKVPDGLIILRLGLLLQ